MALLAGGGTFPQLRGFGKGTGSVRGAASHPVRLPRRRCSCSLLPRWWRDRPTSWNRPDGPADGGGDAPGTGPADRGLPPRAAILTGGALMVGGQAILASMLLAGTERILDASAVLVVPVWLAGIALLWVAPPPVPLCRAPLGASGDTSSTPWTTRWSALDEIRRGGRAIPCAGRIDAVAERGVRVAVTGSRGAHPPSTAPSPRRTVEVHRHPVATAGVAPRSGRWVRRSDRHPHPAHRGVPATIRSPPRRRCDGEPGRARHGSTHLGGCRSRPGSRRGSRGGARTGPAGPDRADPPTTRRSGPSFVSRRRVSGATGRHASGPDL